LLGLLDEGVHDYHTLADQKAVERSANARTSARSELEQSIPERTSVRKPKIRALFREYLERHAPMLANPLTRRKSMHL